MFLNHNGSIENDIQLSTTKCKSEIIIKLRNFCMNNFVCPFFIKKTILQACIESTISYACETRGYINPSKIEILHRQAIKIILGINNSCNNL